MKQISKNFSFRPLLLGAGTMAGLTLLSGVALSYDPAANFRNQPGFRCLYQNSRGECLDFVFDSNVRNSSSRSSSSRSNVTDRDIVEGDRITVELEAEDDEVRRGDIVEYTIRLTNDTNRRVETNIVVNLDADMTFSSASDKGRNRSSRRIEWDDISIRPDGEEELTFRVRISSSARTGDELSVTLETDDTDDEAEVTVEVTGSSSTSNSNSNCSTVYYLVNGRRVTSRVSSSRCDDDDDEDGDFAISISDSPDPFEPGELVTYTITIRNLDNRAVRFDASAELDDEVNFISGSDNADEQNNNEIEWDDLSIGSNGTRTLTVVVRTERDLDDGDVINFSFTANDDEDSEETEAEFD